MTCFAGSEPAPSGWNDSSAHTAKDRFETPVLILSARSEIADKVEGLDAGANDYLPAVPFAELVLASAARHGGSLFSAMFACDAETEL